MFLLSLTHVISVLYILFTDPEYQRCGAGSIHVKWGTDLADRLLVPTWVESSPNGHHLYEANGFRDVEKVYLQTKSWLSDFTIMKREPKTSLEAGRPIVFS
jgi:GNAT superfamily N-acetyltransferase